MNELIEEWKNLEIINFDNHPELKRRLTVYCLAIYEEDTILDIKHLMSEFKYLKKHNKLQYLLREYIIN